MAENFTTVQTVRFWCQKILPLVYDDSLSYYEVLCKLKQRLNEVIENLNNIPDYLVQLILEYINSEQLQLILSELLATYILNVKFPPAGLTPAVGDGSEDDTASIQGCIDYAYNNGGMAVYFPNGVYLTQPLLLKDSVSLTGASRYTTRLVLRGGASNALVYGVTSNNQISDLHLDCNNDVQVNNIDCIEITGSNYLFYNLILNDGFRLLNITSTAGHIQLNDLIFRRATETHVLITGDANVKMEGIECNELSNLYAAACINLGTSNSFIDGCILNATSPVGIILNGDNNNITASVLNSVNDIQDNGQNNTYRIVSKEELTNLSSTKTINVPNFILNTTTINETFTNKTSTGVNITEALTGTRKLDAEFIEETFIDTKTITGGQLKEEYSNIETTASGNKTENITGNKTKTIGGNEINTVDGNSTNTVSGNSTNTINGSISNTVLGDEKTEVHGDQLIETKNTKIITTNYEVGSVENYINSVNPLTYRTPSQYNQYFDYVPFKDNTGTIYDVLVRGANLDDLNKIDLGFINVLDYGAAGDGETDDTEAINNAIKNNPGKVIFFPVGTYMISDEIVMPSNTVIFGSGNNSIIKQFNGANTNILVSENFHTLEGTNTTSNRISNFFINNIKIDGNFISNIGNESQVSNPNNTSGSGLLIYGFTIVLNNVTIVNCPENGIRTESAANTSFQPDNGEESIYNNVRILHCGEHGWTYRGPHDSLMSNCIIGSSGRKQNNVYSNLRCLEKGNCRVVNCHFYSNYGNIKPNFSVYLGESAYPWMFTNCHIEGAYIPLVISKSNQHNFVNCQVYASFGGSDVWLDGSRNRFDNVIFGGPAPDPVPTDRPSFTAAIGFGEETLCRNNYFDVHLSGVAFTSGFNPNSALNTYKISGYNNTRLINGEYLAAPFGISGNQSADIIEVRGDFDSQSEFSFRNNRSFRMNDGLPRINSLQQLDVTGTATITARTVAIHSYTTGNLNLNWGAQGTILMILNNTSSNIPITATGVTLNGGTSRTIPAKTTCFVYGINNTLWISPEISS